MWDNLVVERGSKFLEHWVEQVLKTDKATGSSLLEQWKQYSAQGMEKSRPSARLLVQGKVIPCSVLGLKNISYSLMMDGDQKRVEDAVGCHFRSQAGGEEDWLQLTAIPFEKQSKILQNKGQEFLFNWAKTVVESKEPVKMSHYWNARYTSKGMSNYLHIPLSTTSPL